jgi:hypothetical protein
VTNAIPDVPTVCAVCDGRGLVPFGGIEFRRERVCVACEGSGKAGPVLPTAPVDTVEAARDRGRALFRQQRELLRQRREATPRCCGWLMVRRRTPKHVPRSDAASPSYFCPTCGKEAE